MFAWRKREWEMEKVQGSRISVAALLLLVLLLVLCHVRFLWF